MQTYLALTKKPIGWLALWESDLKWHRLPSLWNKWDEVQVMHQLAEHGWVKAPRTAVKA